MSQQQKEDSVMFSLRSLMEIEEDRIKQEEDEKRRAEEGERMRLEDARRREEDERQAKVRAADEARAAEVRSALGLAKAWGYLEEASWMAIDPLLDRVLAMLWRLTHPRP